MPPVSSVLGNCVVGRGWNKSQPVGGLCEGHRPRRAEGNETYQKCHCMFLTKIVHELIIVPTQFIEETNAKGYH